MKRLRYVFAAVVLAAGWSGSGWAAMVRSLPRSGPAALIQLGGVLGTLPGLPEFQPGGSKYPAVLALDRACHDPARAASLIERARSLIPAFAPDPVWPQPADPARSAVRSLEAVNAALKDFSPEQIRDMPQEDLSRLAGMVLDQAAGERGVVDVDAAALLAQAGLRKVAALRGRPLSERVLNPGHNDTHEEMVDVYGVPEAVRQVSSEGRIFRHYTTAEGMKSILQEGGLWNGFLPYIELARGVSHKSFKDLEGVFLTLPGMGGDRVGVPSRTFDHYVDIRISSKLPVLEVEPGRIFLIPMPARARSWFLDIYRRWVLGGDPKHYEKSLQEFDSRGGPGPELTVPVEIVAHGRI
ncbi:MAG: hypothetical protein WC881_06105 [Elusimicrobiota bacterium]|jgi:hypothetical protein